MDHRNNDHLEELLGKRRGEEGSCRCSSKCFILTTLLALIIGAAGYFVTKALGVNPKHDSCTQIVWDKAYTHGTNSLVFRPVKDKNSTVFDVEMVMYDCKTPASPKSSCDTSLSYDKSKCELKVLPKDVKDKKDSKDKKGTCQFTTKYDSKKALMIQTTGKTSTNFSLNKNISKCKTTAPKKQKPVTPAPSPKKPVTPVTPAPSPKKPVTPVTPAPSPKKPVTPVTPAPSPEPLKNQLTYGKTYYKTLTKGNPFNKESFQYSIKFIKDSQKDSKLDSGYVEICYTDTKNLQMFRSQTPVRNCKNKFTYDPKTGELTIQQWSKCQESADKQYGLQIDKLEFDSVNNQIKMSTKSAPSGLSNPAAFLLTKDDMEISMKCPKATFN